MNAETSSNHEAVIVRLKLSDDGLGVWEDHKAAYEVEDKLIALFESSHLGEVDGHEFGGGFATLFMYGPSAAAMAASILALLAGVSHREGSSITTRFGPPGSPESTTPLGRGAA